ncbi:MAG TPA: hypothetical protein VMN79_16975 [Casimicrobiaceae bacterium]|nr:hypothetical protein [Casimicrobiaceae bacterium]
MDIHRRSAAGQARRRAAICGIVLLLACLWARAQPIPGPATDLYPGTREYVWTFYVPVVTTERRAIVTQGPSVAVRSRRFDYEVPGLTTERRKLGQVPELYCKYPDWFLPNECGVAWHTVYADLPQLTMRREHIDADVPEWTTGEYRTYVDVPHWTWSERTLRLIVPVLETAPSPGRAWSRSESPMLATTSPDEARAALERERATALKAVDEAVAALDESIGAVEVGGGDPAKLASADGAMLDLYATRRTLLDERAIQAARYDRVRQELDAAGAPAAR